MQPTTSPSRPIQASISIFNTISAYVLGFPVLNPIATGILFCDNGSLESNSFFHLGKSCSVLPNDLSLSNSLVFRVLADLPVCICEYATRLVCHHSLTPLWCLPNQRRLLQQKPRAHWSAWCLCSPLGYPSDSASQASWPQSLQAPSISVSFMLCLSLNITCKLSNHYRFNFVMLFWAAGSPGLFN